MLIVEEEALPILFCTTSQAFKALLSLLILTGLLSLTRGLLPDPIVLKREEPLKESISLQLFRSRINQLRGHDA